MMLLTLPATSQGKTRILYKTTTSLCFSSKSIQTETDNCEAEWMHSSHTCQFNCFGHKPVLFQYFEQSQQGPQKQFTEPQT